MATNCSISADCAELIELFLSTASQLVQQCEDSLSATDLAPHGDLLFHMMPRKAKKKAIENSLRLHICGGPARSAEAV